MDNEPKESLAHFDYETQIASITLPFAALSINSMYRTVAHRVILSAAGRKWKERARPIVTSLPITYHMPVWLVIEVWPATRRDYDLDNTAKTVIDALLPLRGVRTTAKNEAGPLERAGCVLIDDSFIHRLYMEKHEYTELYPLGRVEATIGRLALVDQFISQIRGAHHG